MPGMLWPSMSSRLAPPPVDTWLKLARRPRDCTAATESPPAGAEQVTVGDSGAAFWCNVPSVLGS
jgi:hypothetical protein